MSQLVWDAVPQHCRFTNNRDLFFSILEVGKFKIKVLADLVSNVCLFSGTQIAVFCVPHD